MAVTSGDGAGLSSRGLARAVRLFETGVATLSRIGEWIAGIACLGTLFLVCYAVAMRYFFNQPQSWSDEAVGLLIVISVMLAVPEAQRRGENIGVDAVTEKLRGGKRRALLILGAASVAITAVILISEGLDMVAFTRMVGIVSNSLPEIPLWAVQAFVPLGGALLLLVALAQLAAWLVGREPTGLETDKLDMHE
jgi:TRAP-type C4-dicarboxylate transport system permease small subunit